MSFWSNSLTARPRPVRKAGPTLRTARLQVEELESRTTPSVTASVSLFAPENLTITGNLNDLLDGGAGNDALHGGHGDDVLIGGSGHDLFDGGWGVDQIFAQDQARDLIFSDLADLLLSADRRDRVIRVRR